MKFNLKKQAQLHNESDAIKNLIGGFADFKTAQTPPSSPQAPAAAANSAAQSASTGGDSGGSTGGGSSSPAAQGGTDPAAQGGTAPAAQGGTAPAAQGGTAPAAQEVQQESSKVGVVKPVPSGGIFEVTAKADYMVALLVGSNVPQMSPRRGGAAVTEPANEEEMQFILPYAYSGKTVLATSAESKMKESYRISSANFRLKQEVFENDEGEQETYGPTPALAPAYIVYGPTTLTNLANDGGSDENEGKVGFYIYTPVIKDGYGWFEMDLMTQEGQALMGKLQAPKSVSAAPAAAAPAAAAPAAAAPAAAPAAEEGPGPGPDAPEGAETVYPAKGNPYSRIRPTPAPGTDASLTPAQLEERRKQRGF